MYSLGVLLYFMTFFKEIFDVQANNELYVLNCLNCLAIDHDLINKAEKYL